MRDRERAAVAQLHKPVIISVWETRKRLNHWLKASGFR